MPGLPMGLRAWISFFTTYVCQNLVAIQAILVLTMSRVLLLSDHVAPNTMVVSVLPRPPSHLSGLETCIHIELALIDSTGPRNLLSPSMDFFTKAQLGGFCARSMPLERSPPSSFHSSLSFFYGHRRYKKTHLCLQSSPTYHVSHCSESTSLQLAHTCQWVWLWALGPYSCL